MSDPKPLSRPAWRGLIVPAGLLVAALLGVSLLLRGMDWSEVARQLVRLSPVQLAALLALSLANYACRALRWHVMVRALDLPIALTRSFVHFIGGLAMAVTPGRLGELVRIRWVARESQTNAEQIAPIALIDRTSDLAAMALLLGLAVSLTGNSASVGLWAGLLVMAAGLFAAFLLTRPELVRGLAALVFRALPRSARLMVRLRRAAAALARVATPRLAVATIGLGVVGWAAEGYAFHLLLVWLGSDITLAKALAIFTFATLAGGATAAPGGIGGAEAAMLALLTLEHVPAETAVAATIIIRITTLWFALALGLVVFPFAERIKK